MESRNVFRRINARRQVPLMKLDVKMQKTEEITYLEATKHERSTA